MDRADVLAVLGAIALLVGAFLIHPALALMAVGFGAVMAARWGS